MTPEKYDLLVREMDTIARKVALFPTELQASVYKNMVATLLDEPTQDSSTGGRRARAGQAPISTSPLSGDDRNYVAEIEDYYRRFELSEYNDMETSAWVCYYFTVLAPEELRVQAIGAHHYEDMCTITGRKLPKERKHNIKQFQEHSQVSGKRGNWSLRT